MKTKLITIVALTGLVAAGMSAPSFADNADEDRNLFETPGKKQSATDFKPAPDKMKTNFGTLKFEGGAFPNEDSTQKIYDEMDRQRATQAYMDFFPALSLYGIVKSQVRDFGFGSSSDIAVMADFMKASENYLTGNDVTVYAFATLDLKVDGPTVVEIPPGMYGNANDAAFKYLTDFGPTGPDKGKGGKYLFVPPGYSGQDPGWLPRLPFTGLPDLGHDARLRRGRRWRPGCQVVPGTAQSLSAGERTQKAQGHQHVRHGRQHAATGRRFCVRDAQRDYPVRTDRVVQR